MANADDPVVRSSRREAVFVGLVWLAALIYCVGYCSTWGYGRTSTDITYVYGFPDWFFWGIVIPWGCSTLVTWLFAFVGMRDDLLGADSDFVAGEDDDEPRRGEHDV
jgi:hypothetical protein